MPQRQGFVQNTGKSAKDITAELLAHDKPAEQSRPVPQVTRSYPNPQPSSAPQKTSAPPPRAAPPVAAPPPVSTPAPAPAPVAEEPYQEQYTGAEDPYHQPTGGEEQYGGGGEYYPEETGGDYLQPQEGGYDAGGYQEPAQEGLDAPYPLP